VTDKTQCVTILNLFIEKVFCNTVEFDYEVLFPVAQCC
jgi:hypothetical protein